MDEGLSSCSIEGNKNGGDNSLHDIIQVLSEVPLHTTSLESIVFEEGHKPDYEVPQAYLIEERKNVVEAHSKGKEPLNHEEISMPHHGSLHDSSRGPTFKDLHESKGYSKGNLSPNPAQAERTYYDEYEHDSSRRLLQRRTSEHRRRERINAKMRAIQALIPNCDKGDHASILDHAIKYIKALKLQIDIMSRPSGQNLYQNLYGPQMIMRPTMLPRIGYGPWQSEMTPSGYPLMVTPPALAVPTFPHQVQAPFTQMLCPQQFLPTTITPPPAVFPVVPSLPQLTPPTSSDKPTHFHPPVS